MDSVVRLLGVIQKTIDFLDKIAYNLNHSI